MASTAVMFLAVLAAAESALPLASYMKPCSRNDPNLDDCTVKHGKEAIPYLLKGDPKYATPVLNPMAISEIKIEDVNKGNKPTGIDITLRNLNIYGLDHMDLKKARFDLKNKKIDIAGSSSQIAMLFEYVIDGKVLLLPIVGRGNGIINMTDVNISYVMDYDLVTREDGLLYMSPTENHAFDYKPKGMAWHLDNLFNGDQTLGNSTNMFLNENWDILNAELGPFISQAIGEVIKQILTAVLKLVPYDTIFPENV